MKLKKVLMILIALAVVLTMAGVVSAKDYNESDESGDMEVKYEVTQSYVVTIPVEVTIGVGYVSNDNQVKATSVLIGDTKSLYINLTARNPIKGAGIYHLNYTDSYIPYYINKTASPDSGDSNTPAINGDAILVVPAGNLYPGYDKVSGTESIGNYVNLTFKTTPDFIANATKSGTHTDILTFKFKVE